MFRRGQVREVLHARVLRVQVRVGMEGWRHVGAGRKMGWTESPAT